MAGGDLEQPRTRIFDFAVVTAWEERLGTLAELAEPERWTFRTVPTSKNHPLLDSYVRYTFQRALEQDRVSLSSDLACFNTGLLTTNQEEIYGLFEVSKHFDAGRGDGPDNKKWFLKHWVRAGDHRLTLFNVLPGMVSYWDNPAHLVLDPKVQIQANIDHIIRDNLNRFPIELGGCLDEQGRPTDLSGELEEEEGDAVDHRSELAEAPLSTRNALDGAVKHSIRLAERSYRVAVPQFYHGKVQLLLPLYLRSPRVADLALTLERHGNWYRAATVLYPDWAYMGARLLTRPNSEWLGGWRSDLDPREG